MRLLIIILFLTSCNPYYKGLVISKGINMGEKELETRVGENLYIRPYLTDEQWDTIGWHDTIKISKRTLDLWEK